MSAENCDAISDLLEPFMDGELALPEREAVEWHLRDCANCRQQLGELQELGDRLRRLTPCMASAALAACQQAKTEGNASLAKNVVEEAADQCTPPALAMADNAQLESKLLDETKANFAKAFKGACSKGFMTNTPLIDPKASDQGKLFLINAPEANVASIRREIDALPR